MKNRFVGVFVVILALCLSQSVLAWNATGHELVAAIAWDNMSPAAQQKAIAMLQNAPADACLLDLFPTDGRPLAERQREFFMRAATWPDVVRKNDPGDNRPCTRFTDPDAHFIDHFWQGVSGAAGSDAPVDRPDIPGKPVNAIVRLDAFRHSVACDAGPCPAAAERAMQLAWVLHLVGDIHQPLHTAARASSAHPDGDQGGNLFPLGTGQKPLKLHSFWDGIVDRSIPLNTGETNAKSIAYLDRVAGIIVGDHPRSSLAGGLKPGDFDAWSREGFETTKQSLYPASLQEGQPPSTAYRQMAFTIADEAIARGGYRLADVLETMLAAGPEQVTPKARLPAPSHIVVVIEENKTFGNVMSSPKAGYIKELAGRGASLTQFFASHHPSQPNYIDFFAGDTLGVCQDTCPIGPFTAQNLGAALIAAGKTFAGYAENLPTSDARRECHHLLFVPRHCPWLVFSNVPDSATKDFSQFPRDAAGFANLPDVSFVIPNIKNDMHTGISISAEVSAGNKWLKKNLSTYADWAETNNSLLIVTWDEDSSSYTVNCSKGVITTTPPKNHIPAIIVGEPVDPGKNSSTTYTHADLLRTILDIYGIAPFGDAATATDISDIWK